MFLTMMSTTAIPENSDVEHVDTVVADDVNFVEEHFVSHQAADETIATSEQFPAAGRPLYDGEELWEGPASDWNPYDPFLNKDDFTLASWFLDFRLSDQGVDQFFKDGLWPAGSAFRSSHTLRQLVAKMDPEMGDDSWTIGTAEFWGTSQTYRYRNPVAIVEYLLRQRTFKGDILYAPERTFNTTGERTYSDMHTCDWWWKTQVFLVKLYEDASTGR